MINQIFKSKYYPFVFQILSLIVFAGLIYGALGISTDDSATLKQLRNTNLSNLIVWSYWWPIIVLIAVFAGRHWCSICPIELLSFLFEKLGLKKKTPDFIQSGWMIPVLYAFIAIVAIHTWGIHRYPNRMAFYLLSLSGLAIIVSLIYRKRAFCSYFCPVGKLLGLYSTLANWGVRVKSEQICQSCKTKECISKSNQYKLVARSCNSNLYPAHISDNRSCILCTQCVKACPNNNVGLQKIKYSEEAQMSWSEVGMLIILTGFVCYEVMSSWSFSDQLLRSFPKAVHDIIPADFLSYKLLEAALLFLLLPLTILGALSGQLVITGKLNFWDSLKKLTGYLLPLVAFGHVFKALLKTSSRLPYWKYALQDSNGLYYARQITNGQINLNSSEWISVTVVLLGVAGLIYAGIYSLKRIYRDSVLTPANQFIYFLITIVYLGLLLIGPLDYMLN